MTDIVERLEILRHEEGYELAEEAATEIRRLREQCEVMREALGQMLWPDPRVTSSQVRELAITAYRASEKG